MMVSNGRFSIKGMISGVTNRNFMAVSAHENHIIKIRRIYLYPDPFFSHDICRLPELAKTHKFAMTDLHCIAQPWISSF